MTKRTKPITAGELRAKLLADPEWVARERERDRVQSERVALSRIEQEPILKELHSIGYDLNSVWDFVNTAKVYESAIPILIKHLQLPYSDGIRGGIARSLAVREAQYAWPTLVEAYCREPYHKRVPGTLLMQEAKDGLAVALAATATDAVIEELIALAKDRSHGESRILLLRPLKKSKSPIAKMALVELASDPDLKKEIASWRKK